jgi:hypothetical protein
MRSAPCDTVKLTISGSHNPAPALSVSSTCESSESSSLKTAEIPP